MNVRTTIRTLAQASAVVSLVLFFGLVPAERAHALGAGSELVGFPSDPETKAGDAADGPACLAPSPAPSVAASPAPPAVPAVAVKSPTILYYAGNPTPPAPPAAPAPPAPRSRPSRSRGNGATLTDTTITVKQGSRLELNNFGGSIAVRSWAKNQVRVKAEHSRRDWIDVEQSGGVVRVASVSRMGPAQAVDFELSVPSWMPIVLSGIYNDVDAEGLQGGVNVETVKGDIVVRRAAGAIELRSVEGVVDLVDARGTINVSSVNDAVRVAKAVGAIAAEAVNGDIHLVDVDSKSVEATTVNGAVVYDGQILDGGDYRFASHNGDIAIGLSDQANATVSVSTFSGDFDSVFPVRLTKAKHGKRFSFVLGNGDAHIDLESFQGAIQLMNPNDREWRARIMQEWREREVERTKEWKDFKFEMKGWPAPEPESNDEDDDND